jgi:glycosyltransferase involved in cell wall biosynthesis
MMRKVLWVGLGFKYHASGAGYEHVVPEGQSHLYANNLPFGGADEGSLKRKINFFIVDCLTVLMGLFYKKIVYYHPENTVFFSPFLLRLFGKKLLFTVHLHEDLWLRRRPVSFFYWLRSHALSCVDKVVTLSSAQAEYFNASVREGLSVYIPFAYRFTRYSPSQEEASARLSSRTILTVGSNYRDFDFLEKVIQSEQASNLKFELIGMRQVRGRFSKYSNVRVHERLTDEQYTQLLKRGAVMFLPLHYSSANCAIFEAYDNCLPLICTRASGVRDYLVDVRNIVADITEFHVAVAHWLDCTASDYLDYVVEQKEKASRDFCWPRVQNQLLELIEEI